MKHIVPSLIDKREEQQQSGKDHYISTSFSNEEENLKSGIWLAICYAMCIKLICEINKVDKIDSLIFH